METMLMRALLVIGLLTASGSVSAEWFEFAGLSRATTLQDVAKRYPNSTVTGSHVYVSPKDTHDHIFGIELFSPKPSSSLRIDFESPDRKYPLCEVIERSIVSRHGPPSEVREFHEEAAKNRYLVWKLELETVQLQCFKFDETAGYFAEAIVVHPTEPLRVRTPASERR
jgi:hypothetical protein